MNFKYLFLLSFVFLGACTEYTSIRRSEDYAGVIDSAPVLDVYPAVANVVTVDVGNNQERMYDYEYRVEGMVADVLLPALQEKGYNVQEIHKKDIKDKKLYELVDQMNGGFKDAYIKAYGPNTSDVETAYKLESDLGEPALNLAEAVDNDIVVLTRYHEMVKTNGARVRDVAVDMLFGTSSGAVAESASLTIAIVDLNQSKVLWMKDGFVVRSVLGSAVAGASEQDAILKDNLKEMVAQVMKDLPSKAELSSQSPSDE